MITPLKFNKQFAPGKTDGVFLKTTYFYEFPFFWGYVSGIYIFQGADVCGVKLPGFGIAACRKEAQRGDFFFR